jgi:diguanylate cyclase (GGDEF)-like protein
LTLAYIDLDNFKFVNDQWGHAVGDQVLISTVSTVKQHTRKTDFIARLGGDEFLVFFGHLVQDDQPPVIDKLMTELEAQMERNNWPITYSVGMVNFLKMPESVNELIKISDDVMYSVKKAVKDSVSYINWPSDLSPEDNKPN